MNRHDENPLHKFYSTPLGKLCAEHLADQIDSKLESGRNLRVLSCGYTKPLINGVTPMCERILHAHTEASNSLACKGTSTPKGLRSGLDTLVESGALPFAKNAFDRIVAAHFLEVSPQLVPDLYELHRILQPEGQLLLILPNRLGIWARSEQTPFAKGLPFSAIQISHLLEESGFQVETCNSALYFAPKNWHLNLKVSRVIESTMRWLGRMIGRTSLGPPFGGVLIVTARKRLIVPPKPRGLAMRLRQIWDLTPPPIPVRPIPARPVKGNKKE